MIGDTVEYLVGEGRRVFVDLEHFFDGYRHDRDYGLRVVETAVSCRRRGRCAVRHQRRDAPVWVCTVWWPKWLERSGRLRLGIHCQDDTGCAVANTLAAVEAGATHVQCTANGYGERTGNADLFAAVGNLETKLESGCFLRDVCQTSCGCRTRSPRSPTSLPTRTSHMSGVSAFAHKAGLHASAIKVSPDLYNHLDPDGRRQRHAGPRHRDGWPRIRRAQGPRAGFRPVWRPRGAERPC